jgi:hypothetical protein
VKALKLLFGLELGLGRDRVRGHMVKSCLSSSKNVAEP